MLVHRDGQGSVAHRGGAHHRTTAGVDHAHALVQHIGDKDVARALIHGERDAGGDKDAPRFSWQWLVALHG